jgi:hypothetical protein
LSMVAGTTDHGTSAGRSDVIDRPTLRGILLFQIG